MIINPGFININCDGNHILIVGCEVWDIGGSIIPDGTNQIIDRAIQVLENVKIGEAHQTILNSVFFGKPTWKHKLRLIWEIIGMGLFK